MKTPPATIATVVDYIESRLTRNMDHLPRLLKAMADPEMPAELMVEAKARKLDAELTVHYLAPLLKKIAPRSLVLARAVEVGLAV